MSREKYLEDFNKSKLPTYDVKEHEDVLLGKTIIDISGKACNVSVYRLKCGNIEIVPTDDGIWDEEDGWLCDGTTTEGYNDEVIICKFIH